MTPIRILLADDHTLFREGLSALLAATPETEVVGEAGTGTEAITLAERLSPDIILMDIMMPGLNGVQATEEVLAVNPNIGVIMLTMLEEDDALYAAMRAGARGYILKGADKSEVLKTIRAVAEGEALFGPTIAARLASFFQSGLAERRSDDAEGLDELTEREREVLVLIAEGKRNRDIAEQLHISGKTVSNHISNIFNKLQVADRAQAIVKARRAGLGS
jgi:DNA-binding NarL/FixJ family response regulator